MLSLDQHRCAPLHVPTHVLHAQTHDVHNILNKIIPKGRALNIPEPKSVLEKIGISDRGRDSLGSIIKMLSRSRWDSKELLDTF